VVRRSASGKLEPNISFCLLDPMININGFSQYLKLVSNILIEINEQSQTITSLTGQQVVRLKVLRTIIE
jgi:hypothetical protein